MLVEVEFLPHIPIGLLLGFALFARQPLLVSDTLVVVVDNRVRLCTVTLTDSGHRRSRPFVPGGRPSESRHGRGLRSSSGRRT